MPRRKRRFAVALSFPGEHRRFVRNVANSLAKSLGKARVFFDEWYEAELKGTGADLKLKRIYREEAELVVPFFSRAYSKPWCQLEWDSIRAVLMQRRRDDAVVPILLDGARVEGWEAVDLGVIRKAGQSGRAIASELLQIYKRRGQRRTGHAKKAWPVPARSRVTPRRSRARRKTVVLMDSTLAPVVYDEATRARGGTNADDITDVIADLPIRTIKETTSLMWRRDEQLLQLNPDLVVVHFSAFYGATGQRDSERRLEGFLSYLAGSKTQFLIYSRMAGDEVFWLEDWVKGIESKTPVLGGRIHIMPIEPGAAATFRDAALARRLKLRIKELLGL